LLFFWEKKKTDDGPISEEKYSKPDVCLTLTQELKIHTNSVLEKKIVFRWVRMLKKNI